MPLDDWYTMAKVHWHMTFEKQPGHPLNFKFFITYFLYDPGTGPKVADWISHDDEQRVELCEMRALFQVRPNSSFKPTPLRGSA